MANAWSQTDALCSFQTNAEEEGEVELFLTHMDVESIKLLQWGIPVWQVALYVICISICMLAHNNRLGIVVSYGFVFYWGYILNGATFAETGNPTFSTVYTILGLIIVVLAIVTLIRQ